MSSPGTVGGQTAISSVSSYGVVTTPTPTVRAEDGATMPVDEQGTPTIGTRRKAIEDERVDSPTPPKHPRALLALEGSSRRNAGVNDDETTQGAWPPAVAEGYEPPILSPTAERRFNTVMELRAEIAKQELKVIASERARQESVQHMEKIAYDEIEAMQERITHRDNQIRQQEAVIQGQGLTIHEMSGQDEGATYRCADLERMNAMAQEVAIHLKERVISANEEYNVQGFNAEEMYREANLEIGSLGRSLEAMNQRHAIAQSELHVESNLGEETARQRARDIFNKDLERQETIKDFYNQESIQQGVILELQRKLLNEELSLQKIQNVMYERRNEVHDEQLELNEAVEHSRSYEAQSQA